jgi:hypothetical protein
LKIRAENLPEPFEIEVYMSKISLNKTRGVRVRVEVRDIENSVVKGEKSDRRGDIGDKRSKASEMVENPSRQLGNVDWSKGNTRGQ